MNPPKTTQIKQRTQMQSRPLPNCHGGTGAVNWTEVLNWRELPKRNLKFIHDDILPPGASIGEHSHNDEEYYYILSGAGEMLLDGQNHKVTAGDITAVFPGGSHALINTGSEEMRFMVICVDAAKNPA